MDLRIERRKTFFELYKKTIYKKRTGISRRGGGDRKWMKEEAVKKDAPAKIEEKAGLLLIMARKEEAKNTEEAIQTEEKKRNRQNQTGPGA